MAKLWIASADGIMRQGLWHLLPWQLMGCQVRGAEETPAQLLQRLECPLPDLILADYGRGDADVARLLRRARAGRTRCLVLLDAEDLPAVSRLGAVCLVKPVSAELLRGAVLRALGPACLPRPCPATATHRWQPKAAPWEAGPKAHPDHTVALIMAYLSQNYAEKITLHQVAEQVYMNASYVSRLLKKATGKTFTDLLLEVRIEKAKELLRGATKVYEVGERVGIENPKYFSQVFKKHTGATPSEFRGAEAGGRRAFRLAE